MKIIDRYIIKELIGPFFNGMIAFMAILTAGLILPKMVELLTGPFPISVSDAGLIFLYRLPSVMVMTFPMSTLLAALQGFGRLSTDSEIIVMRAGGISFMRMMTWVLVLGFFISAGTLWFNETLVPFGNSKAENLIRYAGRDAKPSNAQVLQDWENGQLSRLIIYQRFDAVSETLYGITMLQYNGGKASAIINADSARFIKKRMAWEFRKGYIQTVSTRGPVTRLPFETQVLSFSKRPDEVKMTLRKADEMTYRELQSFLRGMTAEDTNYLKYLVQLHQKLAIPLASFVFILIGAPLGLRPHRGGSALGFGLAIMIVFFYYVIAHFLAAAANGGGVSPILAAWIPNIVGTAFGFFLISKAAR